MKSKILIAGLAALSLSACTSINPYTGQSQLSNTTGGALVGAGGGAVVGGIIGAATGKDPRVAAPAIAPTMAPVPAPTSAPPVVFDIWVLPVYGLIDVQAVSSNAASPASTILDFIKRPP